MKMKETVKKVLSILLCLCMLVQNAPVMAFAAGDEGLCPHHTEHTADCGYSSGSKGAPCGHECRGETGCTLPEADCGHRHGNCSYTAGTPEVPCGHTHSESCGYVKAVEGSACANAETDAECDHSGDCGYAPAIEGVACGHKEHTDCGYAPATKGTSCAHVKEGRHDSACGYAAAVEAKDCGYNCGECAAAPAENSAETSAEETESSSEKTETSSEKTETASGKTEAPSEKTETPSGKTETPSEKTEAPSEKTETPSGKTETPSGKTEAPSEKTETPSEKTETPSEKTETSSKKTETSSKSTKYSSKSTKAASGSAKAAPARITGVTLTVDGVTYAEGTVTFPEDTIFQITVTGTNFANLSANNKLFFGEGLNFTVTADWGWTIDTEANTASIALGSSVLVFCNNTQLLFTNDGGDSFTGTGIYLTCHNSGTITGVSVTVDGVTYTEGNVTITPDTESVIFTVTGINFDNLFGYNLLGYAPEENSNVLTEYGWVVDTAAGTATRDLSNQISAFSPCKNYEVRYTNNLGANFTGTGIYLTYDDSSTPDQPEDTTPARITGVTLTVDGVTYTEGNVTFTKDTILQITVTGTNFANLSAHNKLFFGEGLDYTVTADWGWTIDTEANTASIAFIGDGLNPCNNTQIRFTNDGGVNSTDSGIFLTYDDSSNPDQPEDTVPAQITGVSVTIDDVTYTEGNVTFTDYTVLYFTVTGTNFANPRYDNLISFAPDYLIPVSADNGWTIDTEANTASGWMYGYGLADSSNTPLRFTNDGGVNSTDSGIFLTYDDGTGSCDHTFLYSANEAKDTITASCSANCGFTASAVISAENAVYDGTEKKTATVTCSEGWPGGELTVAYENNVNAGTATAAITLGGATAEVAFTIEKAAVTVTADAVSKVYGQENPQLTYTAAGLFGSDTLNGTLETAATAASGVGEYDITVGTLANSNYTITYIGAKLTVIKAAAAMTAAPAPKELTYTGEDLALVTPGTANGGTLVYSLSETGPYTEEIPTGRNAGSYTVWYYVLGDSNHADTEKASVSVTVAKANYDLSGARWDYTAAFDYDGLEHTVAVTGLPAGVTAEGYTGNTAVTLGDYTAQVTLAYDSTNYNAPALEDLRWSIVNNWVPTEYTATGMNGSGYTNSDFLVTAREGYTVSRTNTAAGDWTSALTETGETDNGSITFYLKNEATGAISLAGNLAYKLDKTNPTGKVEFLERTSWQEFVNSITFGRYYRSQVTVMAEAADALSGVDTLEYAAADKAMTLAEVKAITDWQLMPEDGVPVALEDAKKFVYFVRVTDKAGNVTYLSTDGAEYDTTAPVITGIENGKTYYTTQVAEVTEKNPGTLTLNDQAVGSPITLEGDKDTVYTISAKDKAGNVTTVTVTMKTIESLGSALDELNTGNATSADKDEIQAVLDAVEAVLKDETIPADEKAELESIADKAQDLLDAIEEADQALETETIQKVENKTESNIKLEDKDDLKKAKAELEKALSDDNKGNYTAREQAAIRKEIDRLDKAIEAIEETEAVISAIGKLPDSVKPDLSEKSEKAIRSAKDAYDKLTNHQKSLITRAQRLKLEGLIRDLTDYKITKGRNSRWATGSGKSLTFTANGPARKFKELQVDGKVVPAKHYSYKDGSTIITLKASYLKTLRTGRHTVKVVYTDGATSGWDAFRIYKNTGNPFTGDSTDTNLYGGIMVSSLLCMAVLLLNRKKFFTK